MITHLIIYGVFEGDRCIMVGSTKLPLEKRAKKYKREYKWFNTNIHTHKVLWEGDLEIEDEEQFRFWRAVKESAMITRMKTWRSDGGKNRSNPIMQALGMPFSHDDSGQIGGRLSGLIAKESGQLLQAAIKGGKVQGQRNKENGHLDRLHALFNFGQWSVNSGHWKKVLPLGQAKARQYWLAHKDRAAEMGRVQGVLNAKPTGSLARGRHTRWHVARGLTNPECVFCQE